MLEMWKGILVERPPPRMIQRWCGTLVVEKCRGGLVMERKLVTKEAKAPKRRSPRCFCEGLGMQGAGGAKGHQRRQVYQGRHALRMH